MNQDLKKEKSAKEAFSFIEKDIKKDTVIGIGTGTTTNFFIEELNKARLHIKGVVCSSDASEKLIDSSYEVLSLNEVHSIDFYIDGADEYNDRKELIKGGGGALTREKILAYSSDIFVCIVDESKYTDLLGKFPLPIEVIEIARSAISRELMKMGGKPIFIRRRTKEEIELAEKEDSLNLPHPEKDLDRVKNKEWLVVVGVCTHLGCVPIADSGDFGGWFCPCHGSHYDISGRIRKGPAPTNLEIPPYEFVNENIIKIG